MKIQVNSQGKAYISNGKALLAQNLITATNGSSSSVSSGAKVWLEKSGQNYVIKDFYLAPNVGYQIVGIPTISNNVVSNFSTSNYLKLQNPFNPQSSTWEMIFKIKTSNDVTTGNQVFQSCKGLGNSNRLGMSLRIIDNYTLGHSFFEFYASTDGSSNLFDLCSSYTVLPNTDYWLKIGWTGTEYYLEYSLDGKTYTVAGTFTSSISIYNSLIYSFIGIYSASSMQYPMLGSIDLSQCHIKINDKIWWSGTNPDIDADNLYSGIAQENITINGSGSVKAV